MGALIASAPGFAFVPLLGLLAAPCNLRSISECQGRPTFDCAVACASAVRSFTFPRWSHASAQLEGPAAGTGYVPVSLTAAPLLHPEAMRRASDGFLRSWVAIAFETELSRRGPASSRARYLFQSTFDLFSFLGGYPPNEKG